MGLLTRVLPTFLKPAPDPSPEAAEGPVRDRLSFQYAATELPSPRPSPRGAKEAPVGGALAETLGNATRHGIAPGPDGRSLAKINQDRGVVHYPFNGSCNEALLCVFDGHGGSGEKVAEFCMRVIPELLQQNGLELRASPSEQLSHTVCEADRAVLAHRGGEFARMCGCTSIIVYMQGATVWTACSGDSRAVLGYVRDGAIRARDLSVDCKPDSPEEYARIVGAGGVVSNASGASPARVWADGRVGLAMSRSIGDGECKRFGVIPDPEIKRFDIGAAPANAPEADGDRFIIVASDGVWEFIDSQEACEIVASAPASAAEGCAKLVHEAAARWKQEEGNYRDDITAIVARLPFTFVSATVDAQQEPALADVGSYYINLGARGISKVGREPATVMKRKSRAEEPAGESNRDSTPDSPVAADGSDFAKRRLSVASPVVDDFGAELSDSFRSLGGWEAGTEVASEPSESSDLE